MIWLAKIKKFDLVKGTLFELQVRYIIAQLMPLLARISISGLA